MGLWYNRSLWPLANNGAGFSSMVTKHIVPLSNTMSTRYGPNHLVCNLPLKSPLNLESYNNSQSPSQKTFFLMNRSCQLDLYCWINTIWSTAANRFLSSHSVGSIFFSGLQLHPGLPLWPSSRSWFWIQLGRWNFSHTLSRKERNLWCYAKWCGIPIVLLEAC